MSVKECDFHSIAQSDRWKLPSKLPLVSYLHASVHLSMRYLGYLGSMAIFVMGIIPIPINIEPFYTDRINAAQPRCPARIRLLHILVHGL